MFTLNSRFPSKDILVGLEKLQNQIPFAVARALTKTAQEVMQADKQTIGSVFDRPTPYALNSLYLKPATKTRLEAKVWIKSDAFKGTPAENFLRPNIDRGSRKQKRYERALIAAGVMPSGYYTVPGAGCPLDAYGNIPARFIVQLLSYFRSHGQQGYSANMSDAGRRRFERGISKRIGQATTFFSVGLNKKLKPGIYMRLAFSSGTAIKPVLLFVKSVGYKQRFDFFGVSQSVIDKRYSANLDESMRIAIQTAR